MYLVGLSLLAPKFAYYTFPLIFLPIIILCCIHGIFSGGFNLADLVNITKLNVRHLGCKRGFLSIQHQLTISPIAF